MAVDKLKKTGFTVIYDGAAGESARYFTIPDGCTEIIVDTHVTSGSYERHGVITVPIQILTSTQQLFYCGSYESSTYYSAFAVNLTTNSAYMSSCIVNGNNLRSSSRFTIFAR